MKRITIIALFCMATSLFSNGQLIINHLNTNITTLTEAEINLAKQTLHIVYGHTSHGSQLIDGMNGLVGFANGGGKGLSFPDDIFKFNYDGWEGALDLRDGDELPGDVGYYPQWYNASRAYLEEADNASRNVMMWSWCGQVSWYSEDDIIDNYLTPMSQLEADFPNVKFVYMTGHLDGTGITGNLHLRNEQIRNYCVANKKILFDFNDIECYDPDQLMYYLPLDANDNCDYDSDNNGSLDKNWAIDWQNSHTENVDWYDCGAQHSQSLNANQKAYAAWRMFAEIAKIIAIEEIPGKLTVSDTVVGNAESACFDATDTLLVAGDDTVVEFQSGSAVDLISGNTIRLLPGFHAMEGSSVTASITTTSQYCFSSAGAAPKPVEKSTASLNSKNQKPNSTSEFDFTLYPNPNNGKFTLNTKNIEGKAGIMVFNTTGKVIYQDNCIDSTSKEITLGGISPGLYVVRVFDSKGFKNSKMLVCN
jgi:hypothetical protein